MFKKHRQKAVIEIRQLTEKEVKNGMPYKVMEDGKEIDVSVPNYNRGKVKVGDVIVRSVINDSTYTHMKQEVYNKLYEPIE